MPLYHIAMLLEISGFLLASIFGGIFLSRDVVGGFASKLDARVTGISQRFAGWLTRWLSPLIRYSALITEHEITRQMVSGIAVRGLTVIVVVIGLIFELSWLFWLGIAFAAVYAILTATMVLFRVIYVSKKRKSWMYVLSYPVFLCWGLLLGFIIAPVIVYLYLIVTYSLLTITLLTTVLMISDNLKKGLIVLGSVLVIIGLILEAIVTW